VDRSVLTKIVTPSPRSPTRSSAGVYWTLQAPVGWVYVASWDTAAGVGAAGAAVDATDVVAGAAAIGAAVGTSVGDGGIVGGGVVGTTTAAGDGPVVVAAATGVAAGVGSTVADVPQAESRTRPRQASTAAGRMRNGGIV